MSDDKNNKVLSVEQAKQRYTKLAELLQGDLNNLESSFEVRNIKGTKIAHLAYEGFLGDINFHLQHKMICDHEIYTPEEHRSIYKKLNDFIHNLKSKIESTGYDTVLNEAIDRLPDVV